MFEAIDLTQVLIWLVSLAGLIVARYVVPLIKAKIGADKANDLAYWAEVAVTAVEEAARAGKINKADKFNNVMEFLQSKGFTLDETELTAVIDSTVWQLINQFKEDSKAVE